MIYTLFYCEKTDKQRDFSLLGVFNGIAYAKSYMTQQMIYDYFIEEYDTISPTLGKRVYQSWESKITGT